MYSGRYGAPQKAYTDNGGEFRAEFDVLRGQDGKEREPLILFDPSMLYENLENTRNVLFLVDEAVRQMRQ